MAKNKDTILRKPFVRSGLSILLAAVIMALLVLTLGYLYELLFSNNQHFRLTNVIVDSSGYWNNRRDDIMTLLDLKYGATNLFAVNLNGMRRKLDQAGGKGIAYCEIDKELPGTLKFNIFERIPVAILYNKKSNMIADGYGMIINANYFQNIFDSLPLITGFSLTLNVRSDPYGKTILALKPALVLISLLNTDFPELNVKIINLILPNRLVVFMNTAWGKQIKVILPFPYNNDAPPSQSQLEYEAIILRSKLDELKDVLKYIQIREGSCSEINLLYKNQAVVS